jgi:hypothetical protein
MTDDVYRERARLVANLAARYPSHMGFTDPSEPDWAVVVIETPEGQMSWHVAPADQGLFNLVRRTKPTDKPWDGHTTQEKYERLSRLTRREHHAWIAASDVSRETSTEGDPDGA